MYNVNQGSKFTFHASALGLGGVINVGGKDIVVPSLASVALAPTGGEGSSLIGNYSRDGIAFTRAESRVVGYEVSCDYFTTYSDIFITNLSVLDRVKVALLQATVTSTRHLNSDESQFELHAMFRGVEVDDNEIEPQIDVDLCSHSSYEELTSSMIDSIPADEMRLAEEPDSTTDTARMLKAIRRREVVRSSIVKDLHDKRGNGEGIERRQNQLIVPNFGKLHFGELLLKPGRRRVNLLRFEFDSKQRTGESRNMAFTNSALGGDTSGSLTVGSGDGNGSPIWPHS
jgi:hypothetical protein